MNTHEKGEREENRAAKFLREQGYRILEQNFRCRSGEIDIIARDGGYLVFTEVKYRKDNTAGRPEEAVDYRKQQKISRVALYYLTCHGLGTDTPCRFDVVAVCGEEIRLYKNAFEFVL